MKKNIVLLFDGTGNKPGKNNTNVVKSAELILNNKDEGQITFYDPGVGISNKTTPFNHYLRSKIGIFFGKTFGYGVINNIAQGYKFLMQNFEPNDRVYILGFSRGAFTARKTADVLAKYGLLNQGSENLLHSMLKAYLSGKKPTLFWQNMTRCCVPHFIGVWDTVSSLGYILSKKFTNNILHPKIIYACHALSIDEKRKHFAPWLWDEELCCPNQKILQVWFPGVHSDVGGWYKEAGLSDIALKWMLLNAEWCEIKLNDQWEDKIDPKPNDMLHDSKTLFWRCMEIICFKKWKKPALREITENSKIHNSVKARKIYRPKNVDFKLAGFGEHLLKNSDAN